MTISHVIYLEFARLIVSWQWVTEVNAMKEMHASTLKARNDFAHHSIERLMGGGGLPVRRV